jgi:hypothetical protein
VSTASPDPILRSLGCPAAPEWRVDWPELPERFPWLRPLVGCPQDARWHPEGDVWTHTTMVGQAMVDEPTWRALEPCTRAELFAAALLHDLGKPPTTKTEPSGAISSIGHSRLGSHLARRELWHLGVEPTARERICDLVQLHAVPYWAMQRRHITRDILAMSLRIRLAHLHLLARCDARGKGTDDTEAQLTRIGLFAGQAEELGCLHRAFPFPSDHARVLYFRERGRAPEQPAPFEPRCTVTLVCGPCDDARATWLQHHLDERPVVEATTAARRLLRAGQDFLWAAPALQRKERAPMVSLCLEHGAMVRVLAVEPAAPPPDERLLIWEPPYLREAHGITRVVI